MWLWLLESEYWNHLTDAEPGACNPVGKAIFLGMLRSWLWKSRLTRVMHRQIRRGCGSAFLLLIGHVFHVYSILINHDCQLIVTNMVTRFEDQRTEFCRFTGGEFLDVGEKHGVSKTISCVKRSCSFQPVECETYELINLTSERMDLIRKPPRKWDQHLS